MKHLRFQFQFIILFLSTLSFTGYSQEKVNYKVACVGFYNVENLFDIYDDPLTNDSEYLPDGANAWDSTKYANKLLNMSTVIADIATDISPDGVAVLVLPKLKTDASWKI